MSMRRPRPHAGVTVLAASLTACGGVVSDTHDASVPADVAEDSLRDTNDAPRRCIDDHDCIGPGGFRLCYDGVCCNGVVRGGRCGCGTGPECERGSACCPATSFDVETCRSTARTPACF
jgi:hypothetical protein